MAVFAARRHSGSWKNRRYQASSVGDEALRIARLQAAEEVQLLRLGQHDLRVIAQMRVQPRRARALRPDDRGNRGSARGPRRRRPSPSAAPAARPRRSPCTPEDVMLRQQRVERKLQPRGGSRDGGATALPTGIRRGESQTCPRRPWRAGPRPAPTPPGRCGAAQRRVVARRGCRARSGRGRRARASRVAATARMGVGTRAAASRSRRTRPRRAPTTSCRSGTASQSALKPQNRPPS